MSIYRVIDRLESTVRQGGWMPFGQRLVNFEQMLDLIEKLRASLPDEVGRAKQVTKDKDRLLSQAKEQADRIMEEASTTKTRLLDESEIAQQAERRAAAVVEEAETRAAHIRRGADEYAERVLAHLDATLATALGSVQKGRQALAAGLGGTSPNGSVSAVGTRER
jgi:cell division septum initiation protein DivIVA